MSVAARFEANALEDLSSPFYFNASHWRAMDGVVEGVQQREGISILTGPTGCGKTMLMRAISENLGNTVIPLFLQYAGLNFREFVNFLHNSLHVAEEIQDASNKAIGLRQFLYAQAERGETSIIFIDEAQNLDPDVLRMLPKLACFDQLEDGTNVGLQFMLTGGSELSELLEDSSFTEVRDAIARRYELRFFTRDELKHFLKKRLAPLEKITPEPITGHAINAVAKYTGGSPRLIGMICSHAMLFAAENPGRSIDESMIEEAAEALMIEPATNPFPDDDMSADFTGPFSSADLHGGDDRRNRMPHQPEAGHEEDEVLSAMNRLEAQPQGAGRHSDAQGADDEGDDLGKIDEDFFSFVANGFETPDTDDEYEDESDEDEGFAPLSNGARDDDFDDPYFDRTDEGHATGVSKVAGLGAAAAGVLGSVGTKGETVISRMKSKVTGAQPDRPQMRRNPQTKNVVAAGRRANKGARTQSPSEKRVMKTQVAGQRQRQLQMAGIAAGCFVLIFGIYLVQGHVRSAIAGATDVVSRTASSAVSTVSGAGSKAVDAVSAGTSGLFGEASGSFPQDTSGNTVVAGFDAQAPLPALPALDGTQTGLQPAQPVQSGGGWGANVTLKDTIGNFDAKLPEEGVSIARGALDLLDAALDKSKVILPEGVVEVAKGDVQSLRARAAANGADGEELKARIDELNAIAEGHFEAKRYIAPATGNAYDTFRSVLDLDEKDSVALGGLERLRVFYSKKAAQARAERQWDTANRFFQTALSISERKNIR